MKVMLVDIDSKIKNIALEKIRLYHEQQGHTVYDDFPLMYNQMDKIYVSCVFTKNREQCNEYESMPNAVIGGSGYDLSVKLPPEIEAMKPKLNMGFTSRGCIRKCPFCIVPDKEGLIHPVADIYDIWDGQSKEITLLDNNILALPAHFEKICGQLIEEGLKVDFNQGLDIRLINDENSKLLAKLKTGDIRFSLDSPDLMPLFKEKLEILTKYYTKKRRYIFVYVLIGYNTTVQQDIDRLLFLKELGVRPFAMKYQGQQNLIYNEIASWVNLFWSFQKKEGSLFGFVRERRNEKIEQRLRAELKPLINDETYKILEGKVA